MIDISFIVPYESMKYVVEDIFREHPDRAEIQANILTKTVEEIKKEDLENADIVIARGYSANRVRATNVPVLPISVTGFDITVALNACIQKFNPKKIAVIGPLNTVYGIEEIESVFPCEIQSYQVSDPLDLEETILKAQREGSTAIIAGKSGTSIASRLGIDSTMILSGRKTVLQSIDEAIRTVRLMRQERERTDRFKGIMDYSFEGILSVNTQGVITTANNYARKVLDGLEDEPEEVRLKDVLPQLDIQSVLEGRSKILGELVQIQKNLYTFNCVCAGDTGAVVTFTNISKIQELEGQIRTKLHKKGLVAKYQFKDIIGGESRLVETVKMAKKFSRVESNIFIYGETGTGKELFAQSIHNASVRREQPFVAINCAALADNLLESELFGYVDGAFTGASKGGKPGLFELAHRGTVFLDEIGDISPSLQSKLLRVLQEREIMRLGHDQVIPIDIKIISASNKNLRDLVDRGEFREDLFYRLNVLKLKLPPLRERPNDIVELAEFFIKVNRKKFGTESISLTEESKALIKSYPWPGNVRELENFCERLCVLLDDGIADVQDVRLCLEESVRLDEGPVVPNNLSSAAFVSEKEILIQTLEASRNKREAAQKLGIDPSTLWRKMKKHGLE
ncbi:MAG: sigma 54-interacting transcriptional regulator [Sphaerochaeta sp.]|uniref:sigma 54-interacting transcriptional regulator n=1 Tax=Sphaerochaeta sp. TaxID=1972642 RepID=UPI002FCC9F3C